MGGAGGKNTTTRGREVLLRNRTTWAEDSNAHLVALRHAEVVQPAVPPDPRVREEHVILALELEIEPRPPRGHGATTEAP